MPLPFIRSSSDFKKWKEAIDLTKKRKLQRDPNDPNFDPKLKPINNVFAYANWLYHNVLRENGSAILEEQEIDGIIKDDSQQKIFEWLQNKVFNDKRTETLDESKKWELVESLYNEFVAKTPNMPMDKLEEFVDTQYSTSPAGNNVAALYGFGGYRDEPPKGPIVFGSKQMGLDALSSPGIASKDPAVVVIPDKISQYDPNSQTLDSLGNVVDNVKQAEIKAETETTSEPEEDNTGDIFSTLQNLGYTSDQLQSMDDEELHNVVKKALKNLNKQKEQTTLQETVKRNRTVRQKLMEAFESDSDKENIYENESLDESISATAKARQILANKFKITKAIKKDGEKYILSQDEVSKLLRNQGYTWNSKYKKWLRKGSPTFWGRKLLKNKFQDKDAEQKDENGKYILNQEDISKKLTSLGYTWDIHKKMWIKTVDDGDNKTKPSQTVVKPTQEPLKTEPINNNPEEINKPEEITNNIDKNIDNDDGEDENIDKEEELSPLQNPDIIAKMKYMQARFILGVGHNNSDATEFDKNDKNVWIPHIKNEDVYEKIIQHGYEWDETKKLWLDRNLHMPNSLFAVEENKKSVLARSILAALGKVVNIKVKSSGTPSTDPEKLDTKMDIEGFIWNPELQNWKYLGDNDEPDVLNESVIKEAAPQALKQETLSQPKKKFSTVDVSEWEARMLMRSLQYAWFKKASKTDPIKAKHTWDTQLADGMDDDPYNGKMDINVIENWLNNSANYEFNDDEKEPMWVDSSNPNNVPGVLSIVGINSKEEYIARAILASKKPEYAKIRAASPDHPEMTIPSRKIEARMKEQGYQWHDDWGWVQNDSGDIPNKLELDKQKWLKEKEHVPWNNLNPKEQNQYKEFLGYRIASRIVNKSPKDWDKLNPNEKKKALNELEKHYEFDKNKKQWVQREKPVDSNFWNKLGSIAKSFGRGVLATGKASTGVAKNLGRYN